MEIYEIKYLNFSLLLNNFCFFFFGIEFRKSPQRVKKLEKEVRRFKVKRVEFKDLFINFRAFGGYNAKFSSVIGFKDSLRRSGGDASFNLFIPGKYRGCRCSAW